VYADDGTPSAPHKIDSYSDTHAFQMKSKRYAHDPTTGEPVLVRYGEGMDVTEEDLTLLKSQAQARGLAPVVALSNAPHQDLIDACGEAIRIVQFEFVR
jgi:hypothetical protein